MALKETNRERQTGILPSQGADPIPVGKIPDGGTQVFKYNNAINTTNIIYTVTAGKILYLSSMILSVRFNADITGYYWMATRDENDLNTVALLYLSGSLNYGPGVGQSFCPPIEIPSLWDIVIASSAVDLIAYGFIHGYEA